MESVRKTGRSVAGVGPILERWVTYALILLLIYRLSLIINLLLKALLRLFKNRLQGNINNEGAAVATESPVNDLATAFYTIHR